MKIQKAEACTKKQKGTCQGNSDVSVNHTHLILNPVPTRPIKTLWEPSSLILSNSRVGHGEHRFIFGNKDTNYNDLYILQVGTTQSFKRSWSTIKRINAYVFWIINIRIINFVQQMLLWNGDTCFFIFYCTIPRIYVLQCMYFFLNV